MNLVEFIVFLITMFLLFFVFARQAAREAYKKEHPEEFIDEIREEEVALREFLEELEMKTEKPRKEKTDSRRKEERISSPSKPIEAPIAKGAINHKKIGLPASVYDIEGPAKSSRIKSMIRGLKSKKEMILMQEVIGPPKSLRKEQKENDF